MSDVDLFGRDSDTTTTDDDGEDGIDSGGPLTVQPAVEAVESPPPPTLGRALFARAVSDDDTDTDPRIFLLLILVITFRCISCDSSVATNQHHVM